MKIYQKPNAENCVEATSAVAPTQIFGFCYPYVKPVQTCQWNRDTRCLWLLQKVFFFLSCFTDFE